MEFTKLSDVTLVNEVSEDVNMLIEDGGEIKRVSASEIILNKPTNLGGYAYYAVYGNYIAKCDECVYPANGISSSTATVEEFVNDYKSRPIMILKNNDNIGSYSDGLHPLVNCVYNEYYANRLGLVIFSGYSSSQYDIDFAE